MREIEYEINKRRGESSHASEIPLTNFRGIELRDFSAEVARLALIIAEYQCDVLYRGQSLALAEFLPLNAENWITCGNALRINWISICPPTGTGVKINGDDLFSTPLINLKLILKMKVEKPIYVGILLILGVESKRANQKSDIEDSF